MVGVQPFVPAGAALPLIDRPRGDGYVDLIMAGRRRIGSSDPGDLDDFVEAGGAGEVDQAVVERPGHAGEVEIPLEGLAELQAAEPLAAARDQAVEMAAHQVQALVEGRVGSGPTGAAPAIELTEEERVSQGPAADRDGRAAGLRERRRGVGDRADVAV